MLYGSEKGVEMVHECALYKKSPLLLLLLLLLSRTDHLRMLDRLTKIITFHNILDGEGELQ